MSKYDDLLPGEPDLTEGVPNVRRQSDALAEKSHVEATPSVSSGELKGSGGAVGQSTVSGSAAYSSEPERAAPEKIGRGMDGPSKSSGAESKAASTLSEGFGEGNEPGTAPEITAGGKFWPETVVLRASMSREQAVARGRAAGEAAHASLRATEGDNKRLREERVARAMAYAAWEYDGKPASSLSQRKEFGVVGSKVTGSLDRSVFGRLTKKEKK